MNVISILLLPPQLRTAWNWEVFVPLPSTLSSPLSFSLFFSVWNFNYWGGSICPMVHTWPSKDNFSSSTIMWAPGMEPRLAGLLRNWFTLWTLWPIASSFFHSLLWFLFWDYCSFCVCFSLSLVCCNAPFSVVSFTCISAPLSTPRFAACTCMRIIKSLPPCRQLENPEHCMHGGRRT